MKIRFFLNPTTFIYMALVSVVAGNAYAEEGLKRVYLEKIELSKVMNITEEELSCDFVGALRDRILTTSEKFPVSVIPVVDGMQIPPDEYVLTVTIENFEKILIRFRPGSIFAASVTAHAEISKNGKIVRKYDHHATSGRIFNGPCGRLENAGAYLGKSIAAWFAKSGLDYFGPDIRNYVLEEDMPNASVEDAIDFELLHYLNMVEKGTLQEIKIASGEVQIFGIDDIRLYDEIEKILLSDYEDPSDENLPKVRHLTLMLGVSGNEKYLNTLNRIAEKTQSRKLKGSAEDAMDRLKQQAVDKLLIQVDIDKVKPSWRFQKRISNMITSGNYVLGTRGSKYALRYYINDDELLAVAKKFIDDNYLREIESRAERKQFVSLMSVLIRYLLASPIHYQSTLVKISKNAGERDVRRIAKKHLKHLQ